ncbi:IS630 family transposase, partial [Wolbachia endosymbiont of Litomosoides brasiliensis]
MDKVPKLEREEKLSASHQCHGKTKLDQSQFEQVEVWIQENPNITIKETRIRIQEKFGLNVNKTTVHRNMQ